MRYVTNFARAVLNYWPTRQVDLSGRCPPRVYEMPFNLLSVVLEFVLWVSGWKLVVKNDVQK